MKKSIIFTFLSLLIFSFSIQAQDVERYSSSRLNNLANQLKRQTVDLADRTSENLKPGNSPTSMTLDAAFFAHQLDASAGLFQQMVNDRHRASALREAAAILSNLVRNTETSSTRNMWRDVRQTISDIERELGSGNGIGIGDGIGDSTGNVSGRAFWKGSVDAKIQISVQGKGLQVNTFSGQNYGGGTFSFTSALPRRNVSVDVIKKKGRGDVRVVQQPNRSNDYTAIIEVLDNDSGAKEYELEIYWR